MAFIINDKIPINCQECFISKINGTCFNGKTIIKKELNAVRKRPDWCPLIEIPKGVKLIDLNNLLQMLQRKMEEPAYQHTGEDWYVGLISAEDCIEEAQIIFKEGD